jgi:SAM-dependent methyltransferase
MSIRPNVDPRRILGLPSCYRLLQSLAGRDRAAPRLLQLLAVKSGDRILDIGCGTADILQYLPAGVDYHGFDISADYVAAARARFGSKGSFTVQPVTPEAADALGRFDVVIALGVLHHLTDAESDAVFTAANKVLHRNGRVITCDGAFVAGQNPLARLLLRLDRGRHVRTPDEYLAIARRNFPDARVRIVHDMISIPYTHCILEGFKIAQ